MSSCAVYLAGRNNRALKCSQVVAMLGVTPGIERTMSIHITTHNDVLRHTARRVAVASSLTIVMTLSILFLTLGTNPAALVSVGYVTMMSLIAAISISASLSGALSYRSALLMQQ